MSTLQGCGLKTILIPASEVASHLRLCSTDRHQLIVPHCPMAVELLRLRVRRSGDSGTRYQTNSEIWHIVLIVLGSFLRQSFVAFTSVTSALEVLLNGMRYINPCFTCLLTYLLTFLLMFLVWRLVSIPKIVFSKSTVLVLFLVSHSWCWSHFWSWSCLEVSSSQVNLHNDHGLLETS